MDIGTEFWHNLEISVIALVIIYQVIHSLLVYIDISALKNIFSNKLFLRSGFVEKDKIGSVDFGSADIHYEDEIDLDEELFKQIVGDKVVKLALVNTKGNNKIITKIKVAINTYLINNYGAVVNFSIIKDIVDREIEVKDDEIAHSVTLPLYLGLAATMIGIIFGLFSMPELSGDGFLDGVNALIGGVKIAMIGSLSGLFFTTLLSSILYKKAKQIVLNDKNDQLTYLQAKLLPELIKAEDTGVSGLKASLDRFARVATTISDNVLIAANQTGENLELQKEVMEKVDNMKILKVSKWNLELFERMENNMEAFNNFSSYLSNMERITSQLMEFANRTSDVNKIINGIDSTLEESRALTRFLSSHLEKIENSGDAALKSVGIVESHFEEAIKSLGEKTEEMINQLYKSAGNHESNLGSIYKEIEESLNGITSQYVAAFKEAYSNSIPKFDQLENLALLPEIKSDSNTKIQFLIENVSELNASLKSLQSNLNNQAIVTTLNSIDENLKRKQERRTNSNKTNGLDTKIESVIIEDDSLSLGKVIKKLF